MTSLQIDFEFDFAGTSPTHQVTIDLESVSLDEDQKGIKEIVDEMAVDLNDEEELEELGWEIDNYLQYEVIMPKLKFSNFLYNETKNEVTFDVELDLWGKNFKASDTLYDADRYGIDADTSADDYESAIEDSYYGTHHNFDITDFKISVLA